MKTTISSCILTTALLSAYVGAFAPALRTAFKPRVVAASSALHSTPTDSVEASAEGLLHMDTTVVQAPLKYIGPYPCLALRFPELATRSEQQRNVTGVSMDFVLDTAANTNTINGQVAKELGLEIVEKLLLD